MQFYKRRDFGSIIGDTFTFFQHYGKNFFKNFLIINGLFIILSLILFFVFYGRIVAQAFEGNLDGQNYFFEQYFQDNPVFFIFAIIFFLVLMIGMGLVMYSYPVLYLKRASETGTTNIKVDEIMGDLKRIIPKFLIFLLGMIFIIAPIIFIIFGITVLLTMILIGILLMPLIFPVLINVMNFVFYDYYHTNRGFFGSLGYAIRSQFSYTVANQGSPFWKYWGAMIIMIIIYYVISLIFALVPTLLMTGSASVFPTAEMAAQMSPENFFTSGMGIFMFAIQIISMIVNMILTNAIFISSGLMYYDSRTDLHRREDLNEIETIGQREV